MAISIFGIGRQDKFRYMNTGIKCYFCESLCKDTYYEWSHETASDILYICSHCYNATSGPHGTIGKNMEIRGNGNIEIRNVCIDTQNPHYTRLSLFEE